MKWDPYSEFHTTVLDNGLTIHARQVKQSWQRMGCMVHSGAAQDLVEKEGTAHFLEHLVSEHSLVPNKTMNEYFKRQGGSCMLGMTSYWRTWYGFFVPSEKRVIKKSLSYFSSMLLNAELHNKIERERSVIINEFNKKYPLTFAYEKLVKEHTLLHENRMLERMLCSLGTCQTIDNITQHDLQKYYDIHYVPANMSIVTVGGYSVDQIVELLSESDFSQNKPGKRASLNLGGELVPLSTTRLMFNMGDYLKVLPNKNGSYESRGRLPRHVNTRSVTLLVLMLRILLFRALREKRAWTYDVSVDWNNYRDFYSFDIKCSSFDIKAVNKIETVIDGIIASVPTKRSFFEKIKKDRLKSVWMNDENGSQLLDEVLGDATLYNRILTLQEFYETIERVSFEDVCNLIPYLVPEKRLTTIIVP
ncbi:MAG: mitochondrial-processing peptidase subunit beta [Candidatus Nomurabacteria bacterium]|nr:mitochondrial-processing peptidase subunit beta [Candidatus Nomurabacteria bacterium]